MDKCITSLIGSTAPTSQSRWTGWNGHEIIKVATTVSAQIALSISNGRCSSNAQTRLIGSTGQNAN